MVKPKFKAFEALKPEKPPIKGPLKFRTPRGEVITLA